MNDDMNDDDMSYDDTSHGDGADDDRLDGELDDRLRRTGAGIRGAVSQVAGPEVIAASLRRQLTTTRRWGAMSGVFAALMAVALVATLVVTSRRDDGGRPPRRPGATDPTDTVVGFEVSPEALAIVDALPDHAVDPHEVRLVASVSRYDTCDTLMDRIHRVGAAHVGSMGFGGGIGVMGFDGFARLEAASDEKAASMRAGGDSAATGGSPVGGETLGTNVAVEGVDEPDSVKAIGDLVVDLSGDDLRIVDTRAAEIVSTLDLRPEGASSRDPENRDPYAPSSYQGQLLVADTSVVVFGHESVPVRPPADDPSATTTSHEYMTLTFVDIGDRSAPRITDRVRIEGGLVTARRVGSKIRLVTSSSLAELPLVYPTGPSSVPVALRSNRLAVADSTVSDWIPDWDHGQGTDSEPLVGCGDVVLPDTFAGVDMTSLVQFDIGGPFEPEAMSILAPSEDLTADRSDVVVMSHVWVDPVQRTDDFDDWATALHRFTFDDDGPRYVASGSVPGSVADQFSVSILDPTHIGVVTADVLPWQRGMEAKVYARVLASDGSMLTQTGVVQPPRATNFATAIRFVGDRVLLSAGQLATVVSVVDLSDRSRPVVSGEVDLGAVGAYIHPIDGDRILVVGSTMRRAGNRVISGIQVATVDLADMTTVARWRRDAAYAEVMYDHHAFTWWPRRSIAAFGFSNAAWNGLSGPPPEAALLTIGDATIEERTVTPRDIDRGPRCRIDEDWGDGCDWTGPPNVRRVLVVEGTPWLYTSETLESLDPSTFAPGALIDIWVDDEH